MDTNQQTLNFINRVVHISLGLVFVFVNLEHQNISVMCINQSKINSIHLFIDGDEDDDGQ